MVFPFGSFTIEYLVVHSGIPFCVVENNISGIYIFGDPPCGIPCLTFNDIPGFTA